MSAPHVVTMRTATSGQVSKAYRGAIANMTFEALSLIAAGLLVGFLMSINGLTGKPTFNPLKLYIYHNIAPDVAFTWASIIAGIVLTLALAITAAAKPSEKIPVEQFAYMAINSAAFITLMRLLSLTCVGIATTQFVSSSPVAMASREMPAIFALVTVALTVVVAPLTETQYRAVISLERKKNSYKRQKRSVANLKAVTGSMLASRKHRLLLYALWWALGGLLSVVSLTLPIVIFYGIRVFSDWRADLEVVATWSFYSGLNVIFTLCYLGLGIRAKWRDGSKLWKVIPVASLTLCGLLIISFIVYAFFAASTPCGFWASTLWILAMLGVPYGAVFIAYRWQRGPAMVVLGTALNTWTNQKKFLRRQVKCKKKTVRRMVAESELAAVRAA